MTVIRVAVQGTLARIALLQGDVLAEYAIWDQAAPDGVGDVYTGRVAALLPAMAGCFVDLGAATGFLPDRAGGAGQTEGTYLTVTVTRAAQAGKGPRLAVAAEPAAARPGLVRHGPGPLLELCGRFAAAPVMIDDHAWLAMLRAGLGGRITYRQNTFDAVLEDEIAALHEPSMALPGGARLHVTPTPALTAIDIDAGAASGQSQLALNLALIPAIARQILLRNLGGAILLDFAGMKAAARQKLAPALATALARDPLRPRLLGFSHLGLAEILRPRIRPALHENPAR